MVSKVQSSQEHAIKEARETIFDTMLPLIIYDYCVYD